MVDQVYRLLYCPIAKNACSSVKRAFVDFGSIDIERGLVEREGIHNTLDFQTTGYLLKDLEGEIVEDILLDTNYFRFVILRDPLERLVSVFREKFVKHRRQKPQWAHIGPVMADVQKCSIDNVDFENGITFEEFVGYILRSNPEDLDPHWCPQYLYISGIAYSRIYLDKKLDELAEDIQHLTGKKFLIRRDNVSRSDEKREFVKDAFKLSPGVLDPFIKKIETESFLSNYYRASLKNYYSVDNLLIAGSQQCSKKII